ncbi:MAG: hypothetical protein ACTTGZ_01200 [Treponema sp.]
MENSIKELGKLRDSIINNRITEKHLRVLMNELKQEFGDDIFMPFDLNSVRQYVYSKAYYERLIQLAKNGACSQEFYIHLLRVKKEIKKQNLKKIVLTVICFIIMGLLIANFIVSLKNNNDIKTFLRDSSNVECSTIPEVLKNEKTDTLVQEIEDDKVVESETNAKEAE